MLSDNVLLNGTGNVPAEPVEFRAGPLSMIFEPENAFLRYIRVGDREVLRGIYAAVRDRNWGTIAQRVSNLKLATNGDAFELGFEVECREGDIDFRWRGTITGDPQGKITFAMNGIAYSTFVRNRIGFCTLHPREIAGESCTVEKIGGEVEHETFPQNISPHQPFKDVRAISHQVESGVSAEVRFEGEVFEVEDQRNWTDASFKTYCTPLERPFPVKVEKGTKVAQSVTLTLKGESTDKVPESRVESPEVTFMVREASSSRIPRLGLGIASHGRPLSYCEKERLKKLELAHLRTDLNLSELGYEDVLNQAAEESQEVGAELELTLILSEAAEDELRSLVETIEKVGPRVARWLVFEATGRTTTERLLRLAKEYLSSYAPGAEFGAGTNAFFTELNRDRPPKKEPDLICYSLNPQVHAFDDASLMETLQTQGDTVQSARRIAGELPIAVTPVTLKPRFNPNATESITSESVPGELPDQVDPRQMSLLGAGWTLGSLKYLSENRVHSVTYYETTGWRGVMETEDGSFLPEKFRSIPGSVFPLYHVLADVGEFAEGSVIPSTSGDPLRVDGMVLHKDGRTTILLANLSTKQQHVRLNCPGIGDYVLIKHLNEENAKEAMRSPEIFRAEPGLLQQTAKGQVKICLLPCALVRIDATEVSNE